MNIRNNNDGYYDDIEKKLGFVERLKKCMFAGVGDTPGLLDTVFQFTIRTRKDGGGKNRFGVVDCNRFEDYGRCKS